MKLLKRNSILKKKIFKFYVFLTNCIWNSFLFLKKSIALNSSEAQTLNFFNYKKQLESVFKNCDSLILTNDCGGGSESYLNLLLEENSSLKELAILKYNYRKGYFFLRKNPNSVEEKKNSYVFPKYLFKEIYKTAFKNSRQVIINNIAFFSEPIFLINQLVKQKLEDKRLIYIVNDYFSICPSFFLLNFKGIYCDIPEIEICKKCLKKNNLDFIVNIERDIEKWRKEWLKFLGKCDEIRVFSESSSMLMKKAYPEISDKILKIKPNYPKAF